MRIANEELLQMALAGYGLKLAEIDRQIEGIQTMLANGVGLFPVMPGGQMAAVRVERKRRISPEGKARIAAATRRRWAAWRKAKKAGRV